MHTRNTVIPKSEVARLPRWIDWLMVAVVLSVSAISLLYTWSTGAFSVSLTDNAQWSWYLVRSSGMIAYTLLAASMLWGLFISSHVLRNWSPGVLSMVLHTTTSWLAVVLSLAHALLLLFDKYYTYTLTDIGVPFVGPYRPFAVGLGVVAFWLLLTITISFSLRRLIGHRSWLLLHYTSYGTFALITAHVLLAGTDSSQSSIRAIVFAIVMSVFVLFGWRLIRGQIQRSQL